MKDSTTTKICWTTLAAGTAISLASWSYDIYTESQKPFLLERLSQIETELNAPANRNYHVHGVTLENLEEKTKNLLNQREQKDIFVKEKEAILSMEEFEEIKKDYESKFVGRKFTGITGYAGLCLALLPTAFLTFFTLYKRRELK